MIKPFIPPKDDDVDYNPEIEEMIDEMLFGSEQDQEEDIS
jgi:hypothetical protein